MSTVSVPVGSMGEQPNRPIVAVSGQVDKSAGALVAKLLSIELVVVVFTQKLAIPLGGKAQVAFALVLHLAFLFYLLAKGVVRIDRVRLCLFLAMMGTALLCHATLAPDSYSPTSIALVFLISSLYIFVIPLEKRHYLSIVKIFILTAIVASGLVWLEWATQIVGLGKPNLNLLIPYDFQYRDYNYINRMWFGPLRYKPNGIFFLETSHVSQFVAMAFIFEFVFFRRMIVLSFLGVSLLGTFGGTGITIILLSAPFLLKRLPTSAIVAMVVAAPIMLAVAAQIGFLDNALRRVNEFDQANASGNIRFVKPAEAVADAATGPFDQFLLGKGAGSMPRGTSHASASFAWSPYSKVVVEYGAIVTVFWFLLSCFGTFRAGIPFVVSWALFVQYHLLNGALAVPLHTIYILLLSGAYYIVTDPPSDLTSAERGRGITA